MVDSGRTDEAISLLKQVGREHPDSIKVGEELMKLAELTPNNPSRGAVIYAELIERTASKPTKDLLRLRRAWKLRKRLRDIQKLHDEKLVPRP